MQTKEILDKFLKDGLKLDPSDLTFVDYYRLPQAPLIKKGKPTTRPIIIKVGTVFDEDTILNSAKNLKEFNATTTETDRRRHKVYITEHLPKEFYLQKKKLMPKFKQARKDGHKTKRIIEQGKYCLLINKDICYP